VREAELLADVAGAGDLEWWEVEAAAEVVGLSLGLEYVKPVFGSRCGNVEIPGGARHGVSVHVTQQDDVGFQALEAMRGGIAEDGRIGSKAEVFDGLDAKAES